MISIDNIRQYMRKRIHETICTGTKSDGKNSRSCKSREEEKSAQTGCSEERVRLQYRDFFKENLGQASHQDDGNPSSGRRLRWFESVGALRDAGFDVERDAQGFWRVFKPITEDDLTTEQLEWYRAVQKRDRPPRR